MPFCRQDALEAGDEEGARRLSCSENLQARALIVKGGHFFRPVHTCFSGAGHVGQRL